MSSELNVNGIVDKAEHILFLAGAWQDFGYENPPSPESAVIPPLGQRSASAIRSGHGAVEEIDELVALLYRVRCQLVSEMRTDSDIRMARPL